MPHSTPDFSRRAQLSELMDDPCSREELRACLRDLAKVNRWLFAYRPILAWLDRLPLARSQERLRILDVGCGYGDTLRRIERWARERQVPLKPMGVDLNPATTAIAMQASAAQSRIRWITGDVFSLDLQERPHVVISSLFTHHLADADVVRFVRWMESNAVLGWFINDLSRAPVPYHAFAWFSRLMRLHRFVQHDGPVSIARSFVAADWRSLCAAAGLSDGEVTIRGFKPGRLCVGRIKHHAFR